VDYYLIVKKLHMSAAGLSFLGFLLRGYWMLSGNVLLRAKLSKVLPHIIDTVLLASAIYLVAVSQYYPFRYNWVTAKLILLVVYIVTGTIALKRGRSKQVRILALMLAIASISAIFALATLKPALHF